MSALSHDLSIHDHDVFFSVGSKLQDADCEVPRLGVSWYPFRPFVYLRRWPVCPAPEPQAPFTSVVHWGWHELWLQERVLSAPKRDAYLRYVDLPRKAAWPFELAASVFRDDGTGDRELLLRHGWSLVDPWDVAGSLDSYRRYIERSRAEFACAKPIYRELKTGWMSERSARYLASGRPVLAEDTGFSDDVPTGGARGISQSRGSASRRRRHQRRLRAPSPRRTGAGEELLDSDRVLRQMLARG